MRIQVLGRLSLWRGSERVHLGPAGQRAVLGLLAILDGQPLPRATMVDALWPERHPPPTAANVIQTHVKHLRQVLEPDRPPRAPSAVLRQVGDGYVLGSPTVTVDLTQFRQLVAAATDAQRDGRLDRAAECLDEAVGLWFGPPLVDVPLLAGHAIVVALAGERRAALGRYGEVMIACGRAAAALPVLESAVADDPLDEAAQARLIRAYHAAGQRARAMAAYQAACQRLAAELNVAPRPELTAAYAALSGPDGPTPVPSAALPKPPAPPRRPARTPTAAEWRPAHLPADVAAFTGRAAELAALDRMLAPVHGPGSAADRGSGPPEEPSVAVISAVFGTAGVGKTALAIRWAQRARGRFPDGQLYIDLRGYDPAQPVSPRDALARFLRALGVTDNDVPVDTEERAACYRSLMDGTRRLVVLDNASSVDQVRLLLPGSASCPVLVTSRDSLAGLVARHGAQRLELDLLPLADAVELIRRLIGERVDAERDAATALALHCARLPLALRVAAELGTSRPDTDLAYLVRELADERQRLNLLDAGGDPRSGVRAILSWSYLHLPVDAARAFRRLGLHPGIDADPYAVAALTGTQVGTARRLLDVLARAHLIQRADGDRCSLHDLLRAYAVERSTAEDDEDDRRAAVTALLDHYLQTTAAAMDTLHAAERHRRPQVPATGVPISPVAEPAAARAWLEAERANLIAATAHAATHGWPEHAVRLTLILFRHLDGTGHYLDAVAMHEHGLVAARLAGDRESQAYMRTNLAVIYAHQGRNPLAVDHLRRALSLYRQVGERAGEARALGNLGVILGGQGNRRTAIDLLQQSRVVFEAIGEDHGMIRALGNLGQLNSVEGNHAEAADLFRRGLAVARRIGDRVGEAFLLDETGEAQYRLGEFERAAELHEQARLIAHETGQPAISASAFNGLGATLLAIGRPAVARGHHQAALALAVDLGDRLQQARAHAGLARVGEAGAALADGETARGHWRQALACYTALGSPEADAIRAFLSTMDLSVPRHRS